MKSISAYFAGDCKFEFKEEEFKVNGTPIVKVTHTGVCGTDMSWWKEGGQHLNIVPGHEFAGTVVEPGNSGLKVGDRVSGYTQNVFNEPCGHCEACLAGDFDNCTNRKVYTWKGGELSHPGSYSQYTTWFAKSFYKLPDNISNAEGALIEPMSVSLHAVNLTDLRLGDKVLVLGGGIIGCSCADWARTFGASLVVISEVAKDKFDTIRNFDCCDYIVDGSAPDLYEQLKSISNGGFDVIFDCCGFGPAIAGAMANAFKPETRDRKCLTSVALTSRPVTVNYNDVVLKEVIWKGSKGHTPDEFATVLKFAENGKINLRKYITKEIPFMELQKGMEELKNSGGTPGKAIVVMD